MMITMALATMVFGAGELPALWFDASDIEEAGIAIPADGTYIVWAWAPERENPEVVIGDARLTAEKKAKPQDRYAWTKAGEVSLKAGEVKAELPASVAAIVLTTSAEYSPEKVMADMRVSDQPEPAHDRRAEVVRHTDTVFTMPEYDDVAEWEATKAKIARRILLSSGLWPLPEKTPLNAKIFDRITHDDYTVEKVYFEARPGLLVTGNLYRPIGPGPFPGVACPHGHWKNGRLENTDVCSVPGRCITMARMGCVVFTYDMEGYVDNQQFKAHAWVSNREKLWGIHPFAVQLWAGIRVLDFLETLPEVDAERLACTGASGGGTQTFALMAVDPRVKVAAPVNMISCSMQGGCICENAPIIRLDNSNMEIGACQAPRPMMMIAATGDWTRETPRVEYPSIRGIYQLYGAEDRVESVQIDAGHNYNKSSREAVYRFFGKWLLNEGEKYAGYTEPPFEVDADLRVFPDGIPPEFPSSDKVIAQTIAANDAKWDAILPKSADEADAFRSQYGTSLALVLGTEIPEANDLVPERLDYEERGDYVVEKWILGRATVGDAVPALLYRAKDPKPQDTVLLVHGEGKAALADAVSGGPGPLVAGLMAQGKAVMAIDTFLIGEHHSPWKPAQRRTVGGFMDTFHLTDTGERVQDVLTALAYLRSRRDLTDNVDVAGLGQAGMWCLLASAVDGRVMHTVIDANQFDSENDEAWTETYYIPCIRAIGDIATAAALIAPCPLTVVNTGDAFKTAAIEQAYKAVGADTLTIQHDAAPPEAILELLR
ncbi:MAG: hypothetical protein QG656_689 [Candidatus Hydrogenedentes bacterium]|nr:hypothetical protein [Candidatus Hydrogenedentota bacterium]